MVWEMSPILLFMMSIIVYIQQGRFARCSLLLTTLACILVAILGGLAWCAYKKKNKIVRQEEGYETKRPEENIDEDKETTKEVYKFMRLKASCCLFFSRIHL